MIHNYVDIILILIVLFSVLRGLRAGALYGLLDLVAWIGSLVAAFRLYEVAAQWIGGRASWSEVWDRPAAFIIISILAGLVIRLVGNLLIARLPKRVHTHKLNRGLGIVPGFVNGLLSAVIIGALMLSLPLPSNLREATRDSSLANRLAVVAERGETALQPVFGDAFNQTLNTVTIRPDSDERVDLPYTVADAPPDPTLEAEMLVLINDERTKVGLTPLEADPEMREVARRHSDDMLTRGYFAHNTPDGRSPFDRIDAAGITYFTAGENLALAPTLALAHEGLMNSPGHRENILRPEFGRVGIGILDAGVRGLMITQNFRD